MDIAWMTLSLLAFIAWLTWLVRTVRDDGLGHREPPRSHLHDLHDSRSMIETTHLR